MKHGLNTHIIGLALLAMVVSEVGRADPVRTIDIFSTKNASGMEASWRGGNGSPPVQQETGSPAGIRFSCPFSKNVSRVFWDRTLAAPLAPLALDLRRTMVLELDLSCARPEAIRSAGLYLKSGDGWYLWLARLKEAGRQKLLLSMSDASEEGRPAGWNAISAMRISFTKAADITTDVVVHALRVRRCEIVMVRGTASVPNADEGLASRRAAQRLSRWLNDTGISHAIITDEDVIAGSLQSSSAGSSVRVAILPYNPYPPRRELKALASFAERGGKLMVLYSAEPRLADLMGMTLGDYQAASRLGQWSSFVFNRQAPAHMPSIVFQESSNIRPVYPADFNACIIATWRDAAGMVLSDPAWVQSDRGVWMSHILLDGDDDSKKSLLLALVGALDPSVWKDAAEDALSNCGKVAAFRNVQETLTGLSRLAGGAARNAAMDALLARAEDQYESLRTSWSKQKYPEVVDTGRSLNDTLIRAYASIQHPKTPEFRGVWNHSGTGLYPGDWNKTCRLVSDAGMTAIFPNLVWAGITHYPSDYIPSSTIANAYGDQLTQSAAAAHRYGLELHVWKVCWNLGQAPASWVKQLRAADRLQKTDDRKTLEWLCPSHPDNIALELNIISEAIRRAKVDGIHLDYVRYPNVHACFCSGCKKRFEQWLGRPIRGWPARSAAPSAAGGPDSVKSEEWKESFTLWRCAQITGFVRSARELIRRHNPQIKLSAAVYRSYPDCIRSIGQDWGLWLKEGLVDFVCPMDYVEDAASFNALVRQQIALPKSKGRIFPGIGVTAAESRLAPDQVIEQILRVRELGAGGFMLFDLNRTLEKDVLPILSLGVTRMDR